MLPGDTILCQRLNLESTRAWSQGGALSSLTFTAVFKSIFVKQWIQILGWDKISTGLLLRRCFSQTGKTCCYFTYCDISTLYLAYIERAERVPDLHQLLRDGTFDTNSLALFPPYVMRHVKKMAHMSRYHGFPPVYKVWKERLCEGWQGIWGFDNEARTLFRAHTSSCLANHCVT